jgi:hypothetical protein
MIRMLKNVFWKEQGTWQAGEKPLKEHHYECPGTADLKSGGQSRAALAR